MKTFRAVTALFAVTTPALFAQYTYDYVDALTSINGAKWTQAGSISASSTGATATSTNGGSVIYTPAIPGATGGYEVKSSLTLATSGGTYVQYLRAGRHLLRHGTTESHLRRRRLLGNACRLQICKCGGDDPRHISGLLSQRDDDAFRSHSGSVCRLSR
jgi:hypothetical protein